MCQRELSVKGWNWGTATTKDQVLSWTHGYKEAFEIPLRNVKKCEVSNDNEVFLEFHEVRNKTVYVLLSFQISLFIPWPYFFPSNASVSVIFFNTMDHQLPATCWLYLLPLEDNQFQPWKKDNLILTHVSTLSAFERYYLRLYHHMTWLCCKLVLKWTLKAKVVKVWIRNVLGSLGFLILTFWHKDA